MRGLVSRGRIKRPEATAVLRRGCLARAPLWLRTRSIAAAAIRAIVLVRRIERTEATSVISRSGLSRTALWLGSRHTAVSTSGTIASARRRKGPESAPVLRGSGLAGATLRLTRSVAVVPVRPIRTALRILVRHGAASDVAALTIRNPGTWTLHRSRRARTASESGVRTTASRNRAHTVLLHGLPQARSLLLE